MAGPGPQCQRRRPAKEAAHGGFVVARVEQGPQSGVDGRNADATKQLTERLGVALFRGGEEGGDGRGRQISAAGDNSQGERSPGRTATPMTRKLSHVWVRTG